MLDRRLSGIFASAPSGGLWQNLKQFTKGFRPRNSAIPYAAVTLGMRRLAHGKCDGLNFSALPRVSRLACRFLHIRGLTGPSGILDRRLLRPEYRCILRQTMACYRAVLLALRGATCTACGAHADEVHESGTQGPTIRLPRRALLPSYAYPAIPGNAPHRLAG